MDDLILLSKLKKTESQLADITAYDLWVSTPSQQKSMYLVGDSTSDNQLSDTYNSPTSRLHSRINNLWACDGGILEGMSLYDFGASGATIQTFINDTTPSRVGKGLQPLVNAINADTKKPLVVLCLGLNGNDDISVKKTQMKTVLDEIVKTKAAILLRTPNSIAFYNPNNTNIGYAQSASSELRAMYLELAKEYPMTNLLDTQELLYGTISRGVPNKVWYSSTNYSVNDVIKNGTQAWKVTVAGTSGVSLPSFPTNPAINTTVVDGTITWKYEFDYTPLMADHYHPSKLGYEALADLICEHITQGYKPQKDTSKVLAALNNAKPFISYPKILDNNPQYELIYKTPIFNAASGKVECYDDVNVMSKILSAGDILVVNDKEAIEYTGATATAYSPAVTWTPNTYFASGSRVVVNGKHYKCIQGGTSGPAFPTLSDDLNRFTMLSDGTCSWSEESKFAGTTITGIATSTIATKGVLKIYKNINGDVKANKVYPSVPNTGYVGTSANPYQALYSKYLVLNAIGILEKLDPVSLSVKGNALYSGALAETSPSTALEIGEWYKVAQLEDNSANAIPGVSLKGTVLAYYYDASTPQAEYYDYEISVPSTVSPDDWSVKINCSSNKNTRIFSDIRIVQSGNRWFLEFKCSRAVILSKYRSYIFPHLPLWTLNRCVPLDLTKETNAVQLTIIQFALKNGSYDFLKTQVYIPQNTPPNPVAGGMYFDGTNFKVCKDGATWVTLI